MKIIVNALQKINFALVCVVNIAETANQVSVQSSCLTLPSLGGARLLKVVSLTGRFR